MTAASSAASGDPRSQGHRRRGEDLEQLAGRVLEMVGARADTAVTATHTAGGLTRFANSFIHQNVGEDSVSVALDVVVGGRPATGVTSRLDDVGLSRMVDDTLAAAAVRPVDPGWAGLAPPATPTATADHYDPAVAAAGPAERAEIVAAFVAAGEGLEAAGYCETTVAERYFLNSAGQAVAGRSTTAALDGIHRAKGSDGCASMCSSRLDSLDGGEAGDIAAGKARLGQDPIELAAGRYEVLLEPRAVAYMLDFLAVYGFNARAVLEGRSFASVGEEQLDAALSVWDDAGDPLAIGFTFDREGTPKARTELVAAGRVVGLTHDRRTARAAGQGATSTGHAVPGGESTGALAVNLFLGAANASAPAEALVGGVKRGLLVSDFWYTRVLDPKTLVVTGLTRNGVFLVEDGQVQAAVTNLRFTQSPVAAFAPGRVAGVGADGVLAPGGLHLGWNHAPSLHLQQWNFTGNASG